MQTGRRSPRDFGTIRKLPSGKYQASYLDVAGERVTAPVTFPSRKDASDWLAAVRVAPAGRADVPTFGEFATEWLRVGRKATKDGGVWAPQTRREYERHVAELMPYFGNDRLDRITPTQVKNWEAMFKPDAASARAHIYATFRTIMRAAEREQHPTLKPYLVVVGGAVQPEREDETIVLEVDDLNTLVDAMPARLAFVVELATWCAMRSGELRELRRRDVDLEAGTIKISRAVGYVPGKGFVVGTPKSKAGRRTAHLPPHVVPMLLEHMAEHVGPEADALLFPAVGGGHLSVASLYDAYYPAREAAGRTDLRFHDLRHTGASLMLEAGASTLELMEACGWDDLSMIKRYGHVSSARRAELAAALSERYTRARLHSV